MLAYFVTDAPKIRLPQVLPVREFIKYAKSYTKSWVTSGCSKQCNSTASPTILLQIPGEYTGMSY